MTDLSPVGAHAEPTPAAANGGASLKALLRARTADRHAALDAHFAGFAGTPTLELYHRFVRMNHAAYRALRDATADVPQADLDGLDRTISDGLSRLETDMATMELEPTLVPHFPLDRFAAPERAGMAYVLDGSKAGARFIHRKLTKAGLLAAEHSALFLEAAFADRENRDLEAELCGPSGDPIRPDQAAAAAEATFVLFQQALAAADACSEKGRTPR